MIRAASIALALLAVSPASAGARPTIAAHRGYHDAVHPENSRAAIREAVARGIEVIEIDLRRTADGEIVVLHDSTLDRTTTGRGPVAARSLRDVRAARLANGEPVPTLNEILDLLRGSRGRLLLDLKQGGGVAPDQLIGLLRRHDAEHRVILGLRSAGEAGRYRALAPRLALFGLVPRREDIPAFVAAGVQAVRFWPHWLSGRSAAAASRDLRDLRARGIAVWLTADPPAGSDPAPFYRHLAGFCPDFILTDRPEAARQALAGLSTNCGSPQVNFRTSSTLRRDTCRYE